MKTIHALKPVRTVAPAETPLTLAEAKAHLRVDSTDEDDLVTAYLEGATAALDGWSGILGRCLVTQTWRQDFREFSDPLRLPFPDVASVAVAYIDTDDASQTLATSVYELAEDNLGAYLTLKDGQTWPSLGEVTVAVSVTLTCGYGAAADVPADLKDAIRLDIGTRYQFRETMGEQAAPNMAYESLVSKHRRVGLS